MGLPQSLGPCVPSGSSGPSGGSRAGADRDVGHDRRPTVAGQALDEDEGGADVAEVALLVELEAGHDEAEELHAEDGVDEGDHAEEGRDVEERGQREDGRLDEVAQPPRALEQPQDAQDARDAHDAQEHRRHRQVLLEDVGGELVDERDDDEEEVELVPRRGAVAAHAEAEQLEDALDVVDVEERLASTCTRRSRRRPRSGSRLPSAAR